MKENKIRILYNYERLLENYSEYMKNYRKWKSEKNKQKKEDAFKETDKALMSIKKTIESDSLLYSLTSKPVNYYENFVSIKYLHNEMPIYLEKVNDKIKQL
jgi:hypothetical protein